MREVSIKPGGIAYMLSKETTLKQAFTASAAAEMWVAGLIFKCATRSGKQIPPMQEIQETAATIVQMFPFVQISIIALFFGYLQVGQRFDEWGEIEHYGEFSLNTVIAELRRHVMKANKLSLTLQAKAKRRAERAALEAVPRIDWDKELAEHPERYSNLAPIIKKHDLKVTSIKKLD